MCWNELSVSHYVNSLPLLTYITNFITDQQVVPTDEQKYWLGCHSNNKK